MSTSSVKAKPAQVILDDGSVFSCTCGNKDFKSAGDPPNWFCICGQVYTSKDIYPQEEQS